MTITTRIFTLSVALLAVPLAVVAAGCDNQNTNPGFDGSVFRCMSAAECNDGFECTIDSCNVEGRCDYVPVNERCGAGEICERGTGCTSARSCRSNADCDDMIDCTLDTCAVGNVCDHTPIHERCSAPTSECDVAMGCVEPSGCDSVADCDDGLSCTVDTCGADRNCSHTSTCPGGERCAAEGCVAIVPCTTPADCDDGVFCNGAEICDPEFGCQPAEAPRMCNDSDDCTVDTCDAESDRCAFACDTSRPECMCPTPGPTCVGRFMVTPAPTYSCAFMMVSYDFSTSTFATDGTFASVTPISSAPMFQPLRQPLIDGYCPDFNLTFMVTGGCNETYTFMGTFTDDDHFTGTFQRNYVEIDGISCTLGGCTNSTIPVTGTRIP